MPEVDRVKEFVRLFTSHEVRLRAFVMLQINNYADAEDVLQQANLVLWEKFDQFQPGTSFMSWAGRVIYIVAMQHRDRQRDEKARFGAAFYKAIASSAVNEDVSVWLAERERALGECISQLKPDHQNMLRMRYSEGSSIEEIARFYDRTTESVYSVLKRVRRTLFECVSGKMRQLG